MSSLEFKTNSLSPSLASQALRPLVNEDLAQKSSPFPRCPSQIWGHIFLNLDAASLITCHKVSMQFREVACRNFLWKPLAEKVFHYSWLLSSRPFPETGAKWSANLERTSFLSYTKIITQNSECAWKELFKQRFLIEKNKNTTNCESINVRDGWRSHKMAFAKMNNTYLVTTSERVVNVWKRNAYLTNPHKLTGCESDVSALGLDNDLVVAAGFSDRAAHVWNLRTGENRGRLLGHERSITCIEMDANQIATTDMGGVVKRWNRDTCALIETIQMHRTRIFCALLKNGKIITGSENARFSIYDCSTTQKKTYRVSFEIPECSVHALAIHNDDLALGGEDGSVYLFEMNKKKLLFRVRQDDEQITHLAMDGETLISGNTNGLVGIYNKKYVTTQFEASHGGWMHLLEPFRFSEPGAIIGLKLVNGQIGAATQAGEVKIWDLVKMPGMLFQIFYVKMSKVPEDDSPAAGFEMDADQVVVGHSGMTTVMDFFGYTSFSEQFRNIFTKGFWHYP